MTQPRQSSSATFRGFGPARPKDAAGWAGMQITPARPLFDRLLLVRHRGDDGEEFVDVPDARLPPPELVAPARLPAHVGFRAARPRSGHRHLARSGPAGRCSTRGTPSRMPRSPSMASSPGPGTMTVLRSLLHPFRARWTRAEQRAIDDEAERIGALLPPDPPAPPPSSLLAEKSTSRVTSRAKSRRAGEQGWVAYCGVASVGRLPSPACRSSPSLPSYGPSTSVDATVCRWPSSAR